MAAKDSPEVDYRLPALDQKTPFLHAHQQEKVADQAKAAL
jgi:hypothetical protein